MRIKKMITKGKKEKWFDLLKSLQTKTIRKCMKISRENWYIDMGLKGNTKPSFSLSLPVNLLACNIS